MSVSSQLVKELRELTGAPIMECKSALLKAEGDIDEAKKILREKGIDKARSKSSRTTTEGTIVSYIHAGGKIGVLVEVGCETDFVARTSDFSTFAEDIAMQIAATDPQYLTPQDVPDDVIQKEKSVYTSQARNTGKPEPVIAKMVEGKLNKFYEAVCLEKQPFIKEDSKTIEDLRNGLIAKLGENVVIRRFVRFQLGECK